MNEKICILIKISLMFIPNSPFSHIPALVQIMAWCRPGDNTLRLEQNGCHFAENIFQYIFFSKKVPKKIKISLKFLPRGSIDNKLALVQVMAWCKTDHKTSPEPMLTKILCLTTSLDHNQCISQCISLSLPCTAVSQSPCTAKGLARRL